MSKNAKRGLENLKIKKETSFLSVSRTKLVNL